MNATNSTHVFERAGLGKAPFRYLGFSESRGPIKLADGSEIGSPGQPMGTCAYCGQGIAILCEIASADGKRFVVGSDCVEKSGDRGLRKVKTDVQRFKAQASKAREAARIDAMQDRLENECWLRDLLASKPDPRGYNDNLLGAVAWMMVNAGHAGKIKTVRQIEKAEKDA